MSPVEARIGRTQRLADLWHDIVVSEPLRLADGSDWLRSGGESDRIAQPGFVGERYKVGGILLLGMNPGGGAERDTDEDRGYFEALRGIRDNTDRVAAFVEWNTIFEEVAHSWKYFRILMLPILEKLDLELAHVSYLKVLKWRNKSEANSKRPALYNLSWEKHTRSQVELLSPSQIIVLGIGAGNWLACKYSGDARLHVIPRTRGDHYASPRTTRAIDQLVQFPS